MVKIISDSTSDLSQDLLDRYNITLVPLIVRLGDQQYEDRVNITSEEIFRWSDSTKKAPTTACANVWTIQEIFQKYLETYDEIVAFSISGKMSATGANMVEAAVELGASDRIHVVDSQSLSTGIGLLVMEAAALMGSMLKLHPKIVVRDGQMLVDKKYRGSLARCIPAYTHDLHNDLLRARPERVFITHSGCDPEVVEQVRTYLTSLNYFDAVIETRAGGVISCHCGPGTLGVLFILKE